jgi:Zn-dependent protease
MPHWWLAAAWEHDPVRAMAWIAWVIVSICLHELGHGFMAIRCGDDVPLRSGHMTLNPFVHIPFPWAWLMFLVFGITWGLMPVQPANFRGRYDETKVAFAGPLVNLLLAVACLVFDVAWLTYGPSGREGLFRDVHTVAYTGLVLNLVLFMFNLLPVPPLDGSRIVADVWPRFNDLFRGPQGSVIMVVGLIVLFRWGSEVIWGAAAFLAGMGVASGLVLSGGSLPP